MAYDTGMAEQMRTDLGEVPALSEKKMFGGLCFLLDGNMICGVHAGGAMFRPGKPREAEALDLPGVGPLTFTGRPMGGMVEVDEDTFADGKTRRALVRLSLVNAASLPAKA